MKHDDVHVTPLGDLVDHDCRRDCWCQPRVEVACPECEPFAIDVVIQQTRETGTLIREPRDDCWRCGGAGWVTAGQDEGPAVVVHNAADGRE